MKITKQRLQRIIQEELHNIQAQDPDDPEQTAEEAPTPGDISPASPAGRSEELKNRAADFMEQAFTQMGDLLKKQQLDITIDWTKVEVDPSGHPSQKGNVITVPMSIVDTD